MGIIAVYHRETEPSLKNQGKEGLLAKEIHKLRPEGWVRFGLLIVGDMTEEEGELSGGEDKSFELEGMYCSWQSERRSLWLELERLEGSGNEGVS